MSVAFLMTLKNALHRKPTTTMTKSFMVPWSGLPETRFHHAKGELLHHHIIRKTGTNNRASIYAPGDVG